MSFEISPLPHILVSDNTASVTVASTTAEQVITFDTVEDQAGITLVSNSRLTLPSIGDYLVTYSLIGTKTGGAAGSTATLDVWIRKNGTTPVTRSSTRITCVRGNDTVSAASFIFDTTAAGDYFEFMMCGSGTDVGYLTVAASGATPVRPAAPGIVATINKISK